MMDCYCAVSGISKNVSGARVEFMAATASIDAPDRMDGGPSRSTGPKPLPSFWRLGDLSHATTSSKIYLPATCFFCMKVGIYTFCGSTTSTLPASMTSQMVIAVFHVEEKPDSLPMKQLINYLDMVPVPITVLVVLPFSEYSTLLLLRIPTALQELLVFILPQIVLRLIDSES